jgi:YggT family protein
MVAFLILLIRIVGNLLSILIIVDAILSFVLSPYHPVREALGRVVNPMLAPIRKILPPIAMMDFSPLVLLVLISLIQSILINLLFNLG